MHKTYELIIYASVRAKTLERALEKVAPKLRGNKQITFSVPKYNGAVNGAIKH